MAEMLVVVVLGVLAIAAATALEPRLRVSAPLVLVVVGIAVSFLPFVPAVELEPEWVLAGVLPPLLYSASVSMPAMDFRREFGAISGLSVALVVLSSVVLGAFFAWVIPGVDLTWGIALGAIVSPTDAVATSIVKRSGVSKRVVALLEGESLLNDATALVLLRTAIAGVASAFSFWATIGDFVFAVVVAVAIGLVVGNLNIFVRRRVADPTVNTVISFTVPFVASLPAEHLGASGLVAAVVAGVVTGRHAPRMLSARHRLSDGQNWRTIEVVLEGAVFLTMGLELAAILSDVRDRHEGVGLAFGVAIAGLLLTVAVRAAYVTPLLAGLQRRARRGQQMQPHIARMQEALDDPDRASRVVDRLTRRGHGRREPDLTRMTTRVRRLLADIDYFLQAPLGWREGTVVVWAGMRGAVTVAAAETLPADTPHRPLLVLVAFLVAAFSLIVQGGSLGLLIRWARPVGPDPQLAAVERERLMELLSRSAEPLGESPTNRQRLASVAARRDALLDARDDGTFDAELLEHALISLDAEQISIELQGNPDD